MNNTFQSIIRYSADNYANRHEFPFAEEKEFDSIGDAVQAVLNNQLRLKDILAFDNKAKIYFFEWAVDVTTTPWESHKVLVFKALVEDLILDY